MASNLQFPRVAITGGAGYVGSALVPYLVACGYEVTVVDLFLFGDHVFGDVAASGRLRLIPGDIRDEELLSEAFADQDAVIHLACVSNDPSFELDPELGKSINYEAFFGVMKVVREAGVKRLVYASTSSVYGLREEPDVREDALCQPLTDYSKYKLLCEQALSEADLGNCDYVILRPATVCGYAPRLRLDVIVNILTINALARKQITVLGGSQLRPNINIKDMVEMYRAVLEAPRDKVHKEVFNGGYENATVAELAEMVQDQVGDPEVTLTVEPTNDPRSYHINSDKIRRVLGFQPRHSIRMAVQDICKAYRAGLIPAALTDPRYYNIKTMQQVNLHRADALRARS